MEQQNLNPSSEEGCPILKHPHEGGFSAVVYSLPVEYMFCFRMDVIHIPLLLYVQYDKTQQKSGIQKVLARTCVSEKQFSNFSLLV